MAFSFVFDGNWCKLVAMFIALSSLLQYIFSYIKFLPKIESIDIKGYGKFYKESGLIFLKPVFNTKHMYRLPALLLCPVSCYYLISIHFFNNKTPDWLINLLDATCGKNRNATGIIFIIN